MMLEELYLGNIRPTEQIRVDNEEYHILKENVLQMRCRISEELTPEHKALVDKLQDEMIAVNSFELQAYFEHGFALGLQMMREAAERNQELLKQ